MARIHKNIVTQGLSGKIGSQLVIQKNGIIRSRPDKSRLKWSDAQVSHRKRFEAAQQFARAVIADPVQKAIYQRKAKKGSGAYQAAISEFMKLNK
jgi:hypothetical protein